MNKTTESFLRVEAIFNEALAVEEEARMALVEFRSNGDREIKADVVSLLKACEVEENLLLHPFFSVFLFPLLFLSSISARAAICR